jgi:hypothetical protein
VQLVPQLVCLLCSFIFKNSGITIVYTLRVNMSVAAVKMKDDLGWTDTEKGLVLVRACVVLLLLS